MTAREGTSETPPDRTRRAVILASAGIVVILGLAFLVTVSIGPVLHTHLVLGKFTHLEEDWLVANAAIEQLGGASWAEKRLSRYIRAPTWIAPRRVNAVLLLRVCGELAVPTLTGTCADPDPDVRRASAWALGQIGPAANEAVPALVKALGDADNRVRCHAAEVLSRIGPVTDEVVPALIKALGDTDRIVHIYAAQALGRIGPEAKAAIPALEQLIKNEHATVGGLAYEALKKIRASEEPEE